MYPRENGNFSVTGVRFYRAEMKCNVPSHVSRMAEKKKSQISYRERFITRPHLAAFIITRLFFYFYVYPHSGLTILITICHVRHSATTPRRINAFRSSKFFLSSRLHNS